jgi:hypothetical protein
MYFSFKSSHVSSGTSLHARTCPTAVDQFRSLPKLKLLDDDIEASLNLILSVRGTSYDGVEGLDTLRLVVGNSNPIQPSDALSFL